MNKIILILLMLICIIGFSQNQSMKIKLYTENDGIELMHKNGISSIGGFLKKDGCFIGEFNSENIEKIKKSGLKFEILIDDLQSFYKDREKSYTKSSNACFNRAIDYPQPLGVQKGSMGGFYTLGEAMAEIDTMKMLFPNLITSKIQIGSSFEAREIYYVKISDNPDILENEPQALYTAIHHSQEPASLHQLIYYMYYLLENYGTDPEVTYLVDNTELFFIPVVNPDGYAYNEQENPGGGGLHRKNRRTSLFSDGVDLNRNYDWYFGLDEIGSSSVGFHPWHRGDSAFSEPETQAVKDFIESHNILIDVNWHAYGNMIIYPWNYENHYTTDSMQYEAISESMTYQNNYRHGTVYETYGYQSNGDADDWGYGEIGSKNKVFSITAEVGNMDDGFWPDTSRIFPLCEGTIWSNLSIAHFAHAYYKLIDLSSNLIGETNGFLNYKFQSIGLDTNSSFTVSFTPLSSNISFSNSTYQYNNMGLMQIITDSVEYSITPNSNEEFTYIISVDNGLYTFRDTISKIYGNTVNIIEDNCETLQNWDGDDWDITYAQSFSGTYSISESPYGNYSILQTSQLELIQDIDLTSTQHAAIQFMMKYDLENNYDYVQVMVSADMGGSWQALCGRSSKYGSDDEEEGEPVYHGHCQDWTFEEISLDDYIGEIVKFKFYFYSDQSGTKGGFFFDNFKTVIIDSLTNFSNIDNTKDLRINISPNPANYEIRVEINQKQSIFKVYNSLGQKIISTDCSNKAFNINVNSWSKGIYYYTVLGNQSKNGKFIVN